MILKLTAMIIEILYVNFMFVVVAFLLIVFPLICMLSLLDDPSEDLLYQDGCYPVLYDGCE